jgi:CheY-like chemotaxis protein
MTRILLVEDDTMQQDILAGRLELRNFDVILATDGQAGIEKARTEKPDIILMDMRLPVIDGWEATRQLKNTPETKHIPIIALTAHALIGDREDSIAAGCDEYEPKPVNFQSLLEKIEQFLKVKSMTKPLALIIEDNEMLSSLFEEAMKEAGYETEIALDGQVATTQLQEITPDLILLDLHLPFVSGADLLKRIRANSRFDATRIIVASADGTWSTHLNEEVDFVLNKPVSYVQLRTLASRLLKSITLE